MRKGEQMLKLAQKLMRFEEGDMAEEDVIGLFQELVDTGLAWQLQGSYGRTAQWLIDEGLITAKVAG
ncbi:MAG: hypothetical protein EBZ91_06580 [Gammaproteobacteria bacterium]|nr:hypothetical protein [Gammaproteobacteria bacterium]